MNFQEKMNLIYGKHAENLVDGSDPRDYQISNEVVRLQDVLEILRKEHMTCRVFQMQSCLKGIRNGYDLLVGVEPSFDELILKHYLVVIIQEQINFCKRFDLKHMLNGLTHCRLIIERMEGVK